MAIGSEHSSSASLLDAESKMTVLAVEDDAVAMGFLEAQISDLGYDIITATNGQEALETLHANHRQIDVVLMDREMPVMDGLTAVNRISDSPTVRHIPVIMVTGADSKEEMKQGLDAGVFYYLTKPVEEQMLRSVLTAALRRARQTRTLEGELGKHRASFNLIDTCKFKFRTLADAESLAAFMANCFADPERVLPGLGELLINAVEHGLLGIGYETKTDLVERGTWRSEVERKQDQPQFADQFATATLARKDDGIYVVIDDPGEGFDWAKYMSIDPSRAGDNHGRGIAQASAISFDKLTYNAVGNKAVVFVKHDAVLEW